MNTQQGKVKIDKDHSNYNFLVHKNGVTILEQDRPLGIISIKEWLEQNKVVPSYSLIEEMSNEQYRVLHHNQDKAIYIVEFPGRKQSINIEIYNGDNRKRIVNKTYNLPIHYWIYGGGCYCLLFSESKKRYPFNMNENIYAGKFYNIHYDGEVCWGQVKQRKPNNIQDVLLAYKQFWGSLFDDEMWQFLNEDGSLYSKSHQPFDEVYVIGQTQQYFEDLI